MTKKSNFKVSDESKWKKTVRSEDGSISFGDDVDRFIDRESKTLGQRQEKSSIVLHLCQEDSRIRILKETYMQTIAVSIQNSSKRKSRKLRDVHSWRH